MRYDVELTAFAERDLNEIYAYIAEFDSLARADRVLALLLEVVDSLRQFPDRGSYPLELADIGIHDFRQAVSSPYRIIYRVMGRKVVILIIVDGRRDMQSLLSRRLLAS
jgi:toxin ParE1/3/4